MSANTKWFRVMAAGNVGNGPVRKSAYDAIAAWNKQAKSDGYKDHQLAMAWDACSARTVGFTSRTLAREADVSNYEQYGGVAC